MIIALRSRSKAQFDGINMVRMEALGNVLNNIELWSCIVANARNKPLEIGNKKSEKLGYEINFMKRQSQVKSVEKYTHELLARFV